MLSPFTRLRGLRKSSSIRALLSETKLHPDNFVAPLFIVPGKGERKEIASLPGQYQLSIDLAVEQAARMAEIGIRSILLFGIPDTKDATGSSALREDGIIQTAIRGIKKAVPSITVMTDLCFCEYTSHGHCGIIKNDDLDNDESLIILGKQAVSHAAAGADLVAPSGMLDGAVVTIRESLNAENYTHTLIMGYSAKFASSFYGPFRDAVCSAPQFGDRRTYQMNPANSQEALRELAADDAEGADILMIKPALAFLDIIYAAKQNFDKPVAAYNVSGEYAMIKLAGRSGIMDERQLMLETLLSIKRAGADIIISYFAEEFARLYKLGDIS